jgi:5-methylcytosine-specific restriction endonuclease McrA
MESIQDWNYTVPCLTSDRIHTWIDSVCTSCGLRLRGKRPTRPNGLLKFAYPQLLLRGDPDNCKYCGSDLNDDNRSIDHILPRSRGGLNLLENLVLCCKKCNHEKDNQLLEEWVDRWYLALDRPGLIG